MSFNHMFPYYTGNVSNLSLDSISNQNNQQSDNTGNESSPNQPRPPATHYTFGGTDRAPACGTATRAGSNRTKAKYKGCACIWNCTVGKPVEPEYEYICLRHCIKSHIASACRADRADDGKVDSAKGRQKRIDSLEMASYLNKLCYGFGIKQDITNNSTVRSRQEYPFVLNGEEFTGNYGYKNSALDCVYKVEKGKTPEHFKKSLQRNLGRQVYFETWEKLPMPHKSLIQKQTRSGAATTGAATTGATPRRARRRATDGGILPPGSAAPSAPAPSAPVPSAPAPSASPSAPVTAIPAESHSFSSCHHAPDGSVPESMDFSGIDSGMLPDAASAYTAPAPTASDISYMDFPYAGLSLNSGIPANPNFALHALNPINPHLAPHSRNPTLAQARPYAAQGSKTLQYPNESYDPQSFETLVNYMDLQSQGIQSQGIQSQNIPTQNIQTQNIQTQNSETHNLQDQVQDSSAIEDIDFLQFIVQNGNGLDNMWTGFGIAGCAADAQPAGDADVAMADAACTTGVIGTTDAAVADVAATADVADAVYMPDATYSDATSAAGAVLNGSAACNIAIFDSQAPIGLPSIEDMSIYRTMGRLSCDPESLATFINSNERLTEMFASLFRVSQNPEITSSFIDDYEARKCHEFLCVIRQAQYILDGTAALHKQ